jgi:hypothetical protein
MTSGFGDQFFAISNFLIVSSDQFHLPLDQFHVTSDQFENSHDQTGHKSHKTLTKQSIFNLTELE